MATNTATNFFQRQEAARRSTLLLVFYFVCAVALIVLSINVLFFLLGHLFGHFHLQGTWYWHEWSGQVVFSMLMLILGGSAITFFQLSEGGRAVAKMVNATPIRFDGKDPQIRQLVNVVEEMAIASGVRLPELYLMDRELGINAFVAGYAQDQAVMVVTAGALEHLSREELQGVVGHEFSHILNGDMRINIRLIALLSGILAIGQLGGFLMRSPSDYSGYRSRSDRGGATSFLFAVGFGFWALGYIGLFFGRLIKAAISRQREILADASSVQFTRNPAGLAGALAKIEEQAQGSFLDVVHAESMSHMCFGPSLSLGDWFATHPPIEERIRAIAPDFLARYRARRRAGESLPQVEAPAYRTGPWSEETSPIMALAASASVHVVARVGTVRPRDLQAAINLKARMPAVVTKALETTAGARALLYAVIALQHKNVPYAVQQNFVREQEGGTVAEEVAAMRTALAVAGVASLPLVDMALPRLCMLSEADCRELIARLQGFSKLDHRLSVFEFALLTLLSRQLLPRQPVRGNLPLRALREPLMVVVAVLVRHGDLMPADEARAYQQALQGVLDPLPPMPADSAASLPQMALALRSLAGLSSEGKRQLIEICVTVVQYDGRMTAPEYELLRVIASLLGCPLPLSAGSGQ